MTIETLPFRSADDLQAMIHLGDALRAQGQKVGPIAADLYEELDSAEVQATVKLWEKDNHLIGYAFIDRYQNIVDVFSAAEFTPTMQAEMINWLVEAARQRNQAKGEIQTLDAYALEKDLNRIKMLERFGFEKQEETSILFARSLEIPIPESVLPPGYTIRPMGGLDEMESYVELHRAAFGTGNMSIEYRQSIMNTPGYLPELDLVAVAPNGDLAALCVCQVFDDDAPRAGGKKEGWTDPVATHPDYRRLGLSRALILAGMRMLKSRGIDTVLLGTSSTNIPMQRVAESIGFRQVSNTMFFSKNVG